MSPRPKVYEGQGNPLLRIRLEPEVYEKLTQMFPAERGKTGGISHWVRSLIYRELAMGEPPQHLKDAAKPVRKTKAEK